MERDLAEKWVAALESGDYPKGAGSLCRHGAYCCLGVLADITDDLGDVEDNDGYRKTISADTRHVVPDRYAGLGRLDRDVLMWINDTSDMFEPVVSKIRRLFLDGPA